ncbi:ATPase family protein associated with various cellular activities (AAA) [Couchioplanes caeruleus]|uniref:ATPase family protein associated with various cellular activities (AAA) n=2 Tax=Couchioplanes caeruleus TaxID=56438 RepID=A0A3N1GDR8_9ACTN|nr:ATPase family protein associated with various cellular activities (AAA) [Couchioplanes caeruleus]
MSGHAGAIRETAWDMETIVATASRQELHGADTAALTEFVELSLGRSLLRRLGPDVAGVPGWSISPREALALLGSVTPTATASEIADRLAAADRALIVDRIGLPATVVQIAEVFALTTLELRLFCLVLAPELDGRYGTVMGVLQDDLTRRRPGLTLLAELVSSAGLSTWKLRRTIDAPTSAVSGGLIRPVDGDALAVDAGLAPAAAVIAHLLAPSIDDAVARSGARLHRPHRDDQPTLTDAEADAALRLRRHPGAHPIHLVGGGHATGWFTRLAAAVGLPLVVGDVEQAGTDAVADWTVLSRLAGAGLLVVGTSAVGPADRLAVADRLSRAADAVRLVATDGERRPGSGPILRAPAITVAQRTDWWNQAADRNGVPLDPDDARRLAATAPIDPELIEQSITTARAYRDGQPTVAAVQRAARDLLPGPLPPGARRIEPVYGWDDLVLPTDRKDLLRAIPLHVLHAGQVLEEWGFAGRMPYGNGVAALFSGPSGTGKTMAAQIVAGALGVDLLQVDLSKTISKYIGETERNLDGLFDAAESAGAVLLFDEADAIFGKRTEVQDAHDRYANVEVAYLLQRMESFRGLAVLTSNMRQGIDDAFVRRLRFVVEFPLPDAAERQRIWDRAFPPDTPLASGMDIAALARRLPIAGGCIQNIALHAAFLAAAEAGPVSAGHILVAARRELVKIGMRNAERSLGDPAVVTP